MGPLLIVRHFHRFYARATLDPDPDPGETDNLLLESGSALLLESGDLILLESA